MRFEVQLDGVTIGFSDLEHGDPPMGCPGGKFIPTAEYAKIEEYCIRHFEEWEPIPSLQVLDPEGTPLECSGGIQIVDGGLETRERSIEIHVCGIPYPEYGQLFPDHVEEYRTRRKGQSE